MTRIEASAAIQTWSTEDRLSLLDELWASLDHDEFIPETTSEVRALLDERIAHAEAHPEDVMTWDDMKAELHAERSRA